MKIVNVILKDLNSMPLCVGMKMPDNKDRDFVVGYINEHFPDCEIASINIVKAK